MGGGGGCQGIVRVMWEEYLQIEELVRGREGEAWRTYSNGCAELAESSAERKIRDEVRMLTVQYTN